eukprot:scaffold111378_cov70-Cyclotella_meneghiniana.AAC.1
MSITIIGVAINSTATIQQAHVACVIECLSSSVQELDSTWLLSVKLYITFAYAPYALCTDKHTILSMGRQSVTKQLRASV